MDPQTDIGPMGPITILPPDPKKPLLQPAEWIFIGGMLLTYSLTLIVIFKGTGVEALSVFGGVVVGHGINSAWANRPPREM